MNLKTIVVETGSSCEIQFGETGIVKIEEDTIVTIASFIASQQKTVISPGLSLGSVRCKVNSLVDNENYDIETTSAVSHPNQHNLTITRTDSLSFMNPRSPHENLNLEIMEIRTIYE
ncbi:MAG: hypothetical protein JXJ04_15090 [Spirochaetales bacterium]|nr:hypothetical protein [Spirochaetales bacterium]